LQPYPDRLLNELPAGDADEPEAVTVAQETIELAYLVAVQHVAPRPRAVLILRDVLSWPARTSRSSSGIRPPGRGRLSSSMPDHLNQELGAAPDHQAPSPRPPQASFVAFEAG
jgi:hypothetical protein